MAGKRGDERVVVVEGRQDYRLIATLSAASGIGPALLSNEEVVTSMLGVCFNTVSASSGASSCVSEASMCDV